MNPRVYPRKASQNGPRARKEAEDTACLRVGLRAILRELEGLVEDGDLGDLLIVADGLVAAFLFRPESPVGVSVGVSKARPKKRSR